MKSATSRRNPNIRSRKPGAWLASLLFTLLVVLVLPATALAGGPRAVIEPVKQAVKNYVASSDKGLSAPDIASQINKYGVSSVPSYGPEKVFNPGSTYFISAAALSANQFVVSYEDMASAGEGTAIIGQVSGKTITYGPEKVFTTLPNQGYTFTSVAALSATKFVVAYTDGGNTDYGTAVIGDVSGTTITFGTPKVFNSAKTLSISVSALTATEFVLAYRDVGYSSFGEANIGFVSGNNINYHFANVFNGAVTSDISVSGLSATDFVIAYCDQGHANYGTSIMGTYSLSGLSYGPENAFNKGETFHLSVAALTASKYVVAYRDLGNSSYGTAIIGDVSGMTSTCGSETVFNTAYSIPNSVSAISVSKFVVAYCDGGNSDYGTAIIGDVSGNTITFGPEKVFKSKGVQAISVSAMSANRFVVAYSDESKGVPGTAIISGVDPAPGASTWYLAEGTTAWGFSTYITIANPNATAVHASLNYMTGSGNVSGGAITLPASSQTTVNPADTLGSKDFSTKVTCTEGKTIAVDRTMSWTGTGAASPEGHSSVGVTAPAKIWYLPEGCSAFGFETWLLIQNPNGSEASCDVTYMIEGEAPKTVNHRVPANSRQSFNMETDIGQKNASVKVASNIPVIPERAMYRNGRREGHDSIGTTSPATDYYLAEGATGYNVGYITYVLVQNPAGSPTDVAITYLTGSGQVAGPSFQMPANSRKTIRLNDQLPLNTDVSTRVHGSKPIIAERAMYWNNGTGEACHDSIGMSAPHKTFYLPDGQTSEGRETWTLVQNPNSSVVTVEVIYMTSTGTGNVTKTESIPANSRKTFNMLEHSGINGRASIMVRTSPTGKKIMVERAMYWNNRGAGTDTIGGFSD